MKKTVTPILFTFFSVAEPHLFLQNTPFGYSVVSYYKIKQGHAGEFIRLWKMHQYPLFKKLVQGGILLNFSARSPLFHSPEDDRWDFKVSLTYKTKAAAADDIALQQAICHVFRDVDAYERSQNRIKALVLAQWNAQLTNFILN